MTIGLEGWVLVCRSSKSSLHLSFECMMFNLPPNSGDVLPKPAAWTEPLANNVPFDRAVHHVLVGKAAALPPSATQKHSTELPGSHLQRSNSEAGASKSIPSKTSAKMLSAQATERRRTQSVQLRALKAQTMQSRRTNNTPNASLYADMAATPSPAASTPARIRRDSDASSGSIGPAIDQPGDNNFYDQLPDKSNAVTGRASRNLEQHTKLMEGRWMPNLDASLRKKRGLSPTESDGSDSKRLKLLHTAQPIPTGDGTVEQSEGAKTTFKSEAEEDSKASETNGTGVDVDADDGGGRWGR